MKELDQFVCVGVGIINPLNQGVVDYELDARSFCVSRSQANDLPNTIPNGNELPPLFISRKMHGEAELNTMLVAELYVVKHLPDATRDTGGAEREKGLDAAFAKDLLQSRDGFLHRLVLEEWLTSGRKGNYEAFPLLSPETVRKKGPPKNQANQAQYLRLTEMAAGGESSNITKCTTSLPAPLSPPRGQFTAARYGDLKVCVNALVRQVPVDDRRDVALRNLRPQLFNPGVIARTLDEGSPSDNPYILPTEFTKNFGSFAMSLFQFHEFTFLGFH